MMPLLGRLRLIFIFFFLTHQALSIPADNKPETRYPQKCVCGWGEPEGKTDVCCDENKGQKTVTENQGYFGGRPWPLSLVSMPAGRHVCRGLLSDEPGEEQVRLRWWEFSECCARAGAEPVCADDDWVEH